MTSPPVFGSTPFWGRFFRTVLVPTPPSLSARGGSRFFNGRQSPVIGFAQATKFSPEFRCRSRPIFLLSPLYEDADIAVINKPAGMVVHPAPGHSSGTLVNALLHHCPDLPGIGGEVRPGIVHRLDKDTTGLLVVAKTADAQTDLSAQFKSRRVGKKYLVLVHDHMATDSGSIDRPIARHPSNRKKMAVTMGSGRHALTRWRRLEHLAEASLLEVDLLTGRTHQIRVHFSAIHHPVIGDPIYSSSNWGNHSPKVRRLIQPVRRQMLHALEIRFKHPESGADICFSAPPPPDMLELICALRKAYTDVSS